MKLSVLIYNNKPNKLPDLLESVYEDYNSVDTEIVIIDKYSKNIDEIIIKHSSRIEEGSLKVIFTNKENRTEAYWAASRAVEGEYMVFLSSSSIIKDGFIEKILITIESINPDIIETDISFKGSVNLKYRAPEELIRNQTYDAKNTYSLVGYISPFLTNKSVKTEFFKKLTKLEGLSGEEIVIIYTMLFHADTYIYIHNPGLKISMSEKVDVENRVKQWDYVIKHYKRYSNWEITKPAMEYAYVRYMELFSGSIISRERATKQEKTWTSIVSERISKEFPNWKYNRLVRTDIKLQRALSNVDVSNRIEQNKISPAKKTTIHVGRSIKTSMNIIKKTFRKK